MAEHSPDGVYRGASGLTGWLAIILDLLSSAEDGFNGLAVGCWGSE
jgi:hypothetical protein